MDQTDKYIKFVGKCIDDVCPYDDASRQRLYHIGFMQAVLAKLMLHDSKNFDIFIKTIEDIDNGRKE